MFSRRKEVEKLHILIMQTAKNILSENENVVDMLTYTKYVVTNSKPNFAPQ